MIANLIKSKQMFSLTLPSKIKGQYWLTDLDGKGHLRQLASIEAIDGNWHLKGNKRVTVLDAKGESVSDLALTGSCLLNLRIEGSDEKVILYTEETDRTRQTLTKIVVTEPAVFTVGRDEQNHFSYDNHYVSTHHAKLSYDGAGWSIADTGSRNGTYVNGFRITAQALKPGDFIYIMGLKIIIGSNYLAVNNPGEKLKIKSSSLALYRPQKIEESAEEPELPEKQYFFRSPRFHREIEHEEIKIDPPPPLQKLDTVPLALMLGPSLTMAMTSVSTGLLTVSNVISSGGNMTQALPSLIMSVSMLLGTVLWPILTKQYEKKARIKNEKKRQEKYLAYLNEIGDKIKSVAKKQSDILHENVVTQDECAQRIVRRKSNLWERVIGQSDFLRLRLGLGNLPMDAEIKYQEKQFTMDDDTLQNAMLALAEEPKELAGVPISLSLAENTAVGFYGERRDTYNALKSLILQMISLHSYDELKLMLVTEQSDAAEWEFVKYVPHFWNEDRTIRFLATTADEVKELSAYLEKTVLTRKVSDEEEGYTDDAPYYVYISTSRRLNKKCDALQQLLKQKGNTGFTALLIGDMFSDFPKETKTVVQINGALSKLFDRDDTTGKSVSFRAETVTEQALSEAAAAVANIELDLSSEKFALPNMITFLEMFRVGKVEHLNSLTRWKENNPTKTLQTPIGVGVDGDDFMLDLHEKYHGPHGLVAGMTGSGKSEFIITYILSLAVNYHPNEVAFILIDYKGGGLTGAFEDPDRGIKLPHLAGTITNLDGAAIKRSLVSIQSELRRRQAIFNEARKVSGEGTMDIYKYQQLYREKIVAQPLPHLFIISDEFAELKTQQPEFMEQLISAARIGRSLGVHLILATQKPSGVVDDQIWSNSKFRVCLKVQEKADSQDMIKCPDAAELSQTGRFYLQVGFNELFALGQSAWCGADYLPADVVEKAVDSSIQVIDNLGRVVMNVKPDGRRQTGKNNTKQIVSIVKYLCDLAAEENVSAKSLWLDPIPADIYIDRLEEKYNLQESGYLLNPLVGEYDDPFNQKQGPLFVPFSEEGNCLIYGATGSGKTSFLTTLCYSLLRHHSAEELNLYLLDFGSETLRVFEEAPQVGGVILSSDEEKTVNFFKMLRQETERRKKLFSDYGGDFAGYIRNSGKTLPNIVVFLNNYSGFTEQYENLLEEFALLTRDGVKYGIYFAVSAGSTNAVRYQIQQNFKQLLTLQLNDVTDYATIVGRTDGLIPSRCKGRGLVALENVFEFQTAYCGEGDQQAFLRGFCKALAETATSYAKEIPVLPETVDFEFIHKRITTLQRVPVGVSKNDLEIATVNLQNKVMLPVIAQDLSETVPFVNGLLRVLGELGNTVLADAEKLTTCPEGVDAVSGTYDAFVAELFEEMVKRNNTYKDAGMDVASLDAFDERVYVIVGLKRFFDQLSEQAKEDMGLLLEKAEVCYKLRFVVCDTADQLNTFSYQAWFKRQIGGTDGIFVGDGIADQFLLKLNKITADLYTEVGCEYGYTVSRNRPKLIKLLRADSEKEGE